MATSRGVAGAVFVPPVEDGRRGRVDGELKVTGQTQYAADLAVERALCVRLVRSPYAHARIVAVEATQARAVPSVRCVLTGDDVPRLLYGRALRDAPLVARGTVRFIGEIVAAVAAETEEAADAAVRAVQVQLEPLPAVLDPERACDSDAPVIHPEADTYPGNGRKPGYHPNVVSRVRFTTGPDVETALAAADRVFERTFRTPKVHQGYIEPSACVVYFEPAGRARIWSNNKAPYRLREQIGEIFDLDPQDVEVYAPAIGGDFGGKGAPMDVPLCLELSRRTGRAVRMVRTSSEELAAGSPAPGSAITIRMGVSHAGVIQALHVRGYYDAGAYGGFTPSAAIRAVPGTPYRLPCADVAMTRVYTNTVPNGNFRAPGAAQCTFAMEGMLEHVARELDIDPLELRRRNLLRQGDTNLRGQVWPEVRGVETVDAAARALAETPALPAAPGILLGTGVAVYDRPTHQPMPTSLRLCTLADGRIEAQVAIAETGTGSHTVLRGVLADALGVPADRFVVRYVGTPELPWDEGVGGSRVTVSTVEAASAAAAAFTEQLRRATAALLGVTDDAVEARPELRLAVADRGQFDLAELVQRGLHVEAMGEVADHENHHGGDAATSYCVQVARVGVDVETGQVQVFDLLSAHDVAEVLNPLLFQGQIEGGTIMGFGFAMCEDLHILDGQVQAGHLGEYKLPSVADVPPLRTVLVPGARGVGARNVKSIGEISNVPTAAAIANAVSNAIGACVDTLPVSAERVLALLQARGVAAGAATLG